MPPPMAPADWFDVATTRVEALHTLENQLADEIRRLAQDEMTASAWSLGLAAAAALLSVAGTLAAAVLAAHWIAEPLGRLTTTMNDLASGDLDADINVDTGPLEIRALGGAMEVFRQSMRANETLSQGLKEAQKLASLGAMVGGIAHEINTPIGNALMVGTSLSGAVQAFHNEVSAGAVRRSSVDRFLNSAREAASLLELNLTRASDQIRSFKQMAVDQTGNHRRGFNLRANVEDAVRSCTPVLKAARVRVEQKVPDDITMDSFPGGLSQVIVNLVENAVRHGLRDRHDGSIQIGARRIPEMASVCVWVCDNGQGVGADIADKVFGAFFTTRSGDGGSGLGLHIVKTIVGQQLGGGISLRERVGGGATFEITIPLCAPSPDAGSSGVSAFGKSS